MQIWLDRPPPPLPSGDGVMVDELRGGMVYRFDRTGLTVTDQAGKRILLSHERTIADLRVEIDTLKHGLGVVKAELKRAESNLTGSSTKLKNTAALNLGLRMRAEKAEATNGQLRGDLVKAEMTLQKFADEIKDAHAEIARLRTADEPRAEAERMMAENVTKIHADYMAEIAGLKTELEMARGTIKTQAAQLAEVEAAKKKFANQSVEAMTIMSRKAHAESVELKAQLAANGLGKQEAGLKKLVARQADEIAKLRTELAAKPPAQDFADFKLRFEKQTDADSAEIARLKEVISSWCRELERERAKVVKLEAELAAPADQRLIKLRLELDYEREARRRMNTAAKQLMNAGSEERKETAAALLPKAVERKVSSADRKRALKKRKFFDSDSTSEESE